MPAASPLKVFGGMLTFFWERAGLTPEELGGRAYVETASNGDAIAVRDTTDHGTGPTLTFTPAAWATFTTGLKP